MFKSFFKKKKVATNTDTFEVSKKIFSLACILVEAAMADENFGKDEKNIIVKILKKQFNVNNIKDLNTTVNKAIKAFNESSDLITYTREIKDNWPLEKRVEVIEMLWKVCLVDGVLEPYEDMLIRRVSGLIYVDDRNRKIAKDKALKKLNVK